MQKNELLMPADIDSPPDKDASVPINAYPESLIPVQILNSHLLRSAVLRQSLEYCHGSIHDTSVHIGNMREDACDVCTPHSHFHKAIGLGGRGMPVACMLAPFTASVL